jgi:hypothetical protein
VRAKTLPIVLDAPLYARLEQRAAAFERDALQEARWLLRQALGDTPDLVPAGGGEEDPAIPGGQ